jgi:DNA-binding IscR family transcriptional regulator
MKRDGRLSMMLHALLHMRERAEPMTSEAIGKCVDTNPVVVRRAMAGLREAGIVRAERGHNGGWSLGRPPSQITLRAIYEALGEPALFAMGNRTESPGCLVERAVNGALEGALREAEAVVLHHLDAITLASIAARIDHRFTEAKRRARTK